MSKKRLYTAIASALSARANCEGTNWQWFDTWTSRLQSIERNLLPSGSGFDNGTRISIDECTDQKLVLETSYHHMDGNGYYCGWTDHKVTVRASLQFGIDIKVGGRNYRDIKDYIAETFELVLSQFGEFEAESDAFIVDTDTIGT